MALHETLYRGVDGGHADSAKRPGSTLVMADINTFSGACVLLSVGDSRAWHLHLERSLLTHDHCHNEFEWRDGEIDRAHYAQQRQLTTHAVAQAVGFGSYAIVKQDDGRKPCAFTLQLRIDLTSDLPPALAGHADVKRLSLAVGETLLLASDGAWSHPAGGLPPLDETTHATLAQSIEALARESLRLGADDNITVAAYRQGALQHPASGSGDQQ